MLKGLVRTWSKCNWAFSVVSALRRNSWYLSLFSSSCLMTSEKSVDVFLSGLIWRSMSPCSSAIFSLGMSLSLWLSSSGVDWTTSAVLGPSTFSFSPTASSFLNPMLEARIPFLGSEVPVTRNLWPRLIVWLSVFCNSRVFVVCPFSFSTRFFPFSCGCFCLATLCSKSPVLCFDGS